MAKLRLKDLRENVKKMVSLVISEEKKLTINQALLRKRNAKLLVKEQEKEVNLL